MPSEWVGWHRGYEDGKPLAKRLAVVQDLIREALDLHPPGMIRVISICAGDCRDLLGVLVAHQRRGDVRARLVELDPDLVVAARARISDDRLAHVDVVRGDAASTDRYAGAVPADLVLACGIFGNVSDADVHHTIEQLPRLCAARATVIWTRGTFPPDLTPTIRRWFSEAGFSEVAFLPIAGTTASVGAHRLEAEPAEFRTGLRLFTFLAKENRPSSRNS